ncbi:Hypothetical protein SA1_141726 [Staphylococcus aureus subsp. aureus PSP1996]|uniref:Uncharacterized protein n=1 Tax=Staphylococcus aureus (strain NCTC 8325 / PS 47) TaxID=93061 RepID=Q2G211_STAA8|nr:hypothetical protein SAOUHSC_00630 [Staphylococcus aureus subsp. aureus NCTC 8325]ESR30567.1 Hypothetical protein SA1_141726 [Staphylococcus aureus subsp. aureus PSP1996]
MLFPLNTCPPPIKRDIETELTKDIMAMSMIESKKETVPISTLNTPTIDITTALVVSNVTTRSAVVGPLINLNKQMINAIPKIMSELIIIICVIVCIIATPPILSLHNA